MDLSKEIEELMKINDEQSNYSCERSHRYLKMIGEKANAKLRLSEKTSSGRIKQESHNIRVELRYCEHKKMYKKCSFLPRTSSQSA
jgi:hypothetical protein